MDCKFYIVNSGLFDKQSFAMRKNFTEKNIVRKFAETFYETGLSKKLLTKYINNNVQCHLSEDEKLKPVQFTSFFGIFSLLIVGNALAFVVFVTEKVYFRFQLNNIKF